MSPRRQRPPKRRDGETLQRTLDAAVRAEQEGRLALAAEGYRHCLEHDPRNIALMHRLALVLGQQGIRDEAVRLLRKAARLSPGDASIQANLGNLLREAGDEAAAIGAYRQALALAPGHANARFNLATLLARGGEHAAAEEQLKHLAAAHPEDAGVADALARSLLEQMRLDDAEQCLEAATGRSPGNAALHATRGDLLAARLEWLQAEEAYSRAVQLDPLHVEGWNNLAVTRLELGHPEEALAAARKAERLAPDYTKARVNAAAALAAMQRWDDALQLARACSREAPDLTNAQLLLARCLIATGSPGQAVAPLRRIVELNPGDADSRHKLAALLRMVGDHTEAMRLLDLLLAEHPEHALGWSTRGQVCVDLGDLAEAERSFDRAVALDATLPDPWLHLSGLPGFAQRSDDLGEVERRLEGSLASGDTDNERRAKTHFALGRLHEQRQSFEQAFAHYQAGNTLLSKERPFDAHAYRGLVDSLIHTFDRSFFAQRRDWGVNSEKPVFVVGMPRSGTTLTEQIMASHSAVHGAGELAWLPELIGRLPELAGGGMPYPGAAAALSAAAVAKLATQSLNHLADLSPASERIIDKLPGNYIHLGLLALLFPDARVVFTRRNAMDVCVSNYLQLFTNGHGYSFDLDALAMVYKEHERLMAHWRAVLPLRVFELRYEDLVSDQEGRSRALIDFLGLPWEDRCLAFHETRRTVRTASHLQVRRPMYSDSVERWRRYGPVLERLQAALQDDAAAPTGAVVTLPDGSPRTGP